MAAPCSKYAVPSQGSFMTWPSTTSRTWLPKSEVSSTPRPPMSTECRGFWVTRPMPRKSIASSSERMPKRRISAAVIVVVVAGASLASSSDFEAPDTTF